VQAHRHPILNLLAQENLDEQIQSMDECRILLQLLRLLCDRFEQRDANLSLVILVVRETLEAYRNLYSAGILQRSSYEILKHIVSRIIARMATSAEDLCVTAYVQSPIGRNELRAPEQGLTIYSPCWGGDENGENPSSRARDTVDGGPLDQSQTALSDGSSSGEDLEDEELENELDAEETESEEFVIYREFQRQLFAG
jgi:hypothetical protein